ncbi:MAG: hypothetical protein ACLT1W_13855 [Alistipes onderdonkii]
MTPNVEEYEDDGEHVTKAGEVGNVPGSAHENSVISVPTMLRRRGRKTSSVVE